jgi:hypothetical protein
MIEVTLLHNQFCSVNWLAFQRWRTYVHETHLSYLPSRTFHLFILLILLFTVISRPMDLQTMGRKIKSHSYMSKKAFYEDLNLIWDNCLTYNTDPVWYTHHLVSRKLISYNRIIPFDEQLSTCARKQTKSCVVSQTDMNGSHQA